MVLEKCRGCGQQYGAVVHTKADWDRLECAGCRQMLSAVIFTSGEPSFIEEACARFRAIMGEDRAEPEWVPRLGVVARDPTEARKPAHPGDAKAD